MNDALFVPPAKDGRRLYARSIFWREGVVMRGPWILPGAPDSGWYDFLVQTATFLRKGHIESVEVNYTPAWYREGGDPKTHEYRLMRTEQAREANLDPRRA